MWEFLNILVQGSILSGEFRRKICQIYPNNDHISYFFKTIAKFSILSTIRFTILCLLSIGNTPYFFYVVNLYLAISINAPVLAII